jgi:hypothetical protein
MIAALRHRGPSTVPVVTVRLGTATSTFMQGTERPLDCRNRGTHHG